MDAAREGVVDEPVSVRRVHVGDDVPVHAGVAGPHEDLAKDDIAVAGRRAGGGKGRALVLVDVNIEFLVRGRKGLSGERVGSHLEGIVELSDVDHRVDGNDVTEIDWPAPRLAAGIRSAVGDALHLGQILIVVLAQEERVGLEADCVPARLRIVAVLHHTELANVLGDLVGHQ